MRVLDVSDLGDMRQIGYYDPLLCSPTDMEVSPPYIYLALRYCGIIVLEYYEIRTEEVRSNVAARMGAMVVYPNPFSRSATQLSNRVVWDGRGDAGDLLPSGPYFCRLSAGDLRPAKKVIPLG